MSGRTSLPAGLVPAIRACLARIARAYGLDRAVLEAAVREALDAPEERS